MEIVFSAATAGAAQLRNAEEVWKALERLPAPERDKKILEGAKGEGEMVWYTNSGLDNANGYIRAFRKAYAFVQPKLWRGKSRAVTDKLLTEARAGVFLADVIKTTSDHLPVVFAQNLIGRYESPIRASYPDYAKGPLWTNINYAFRVFGFNNKMISAQDAPKSWDELLDPKWKGKILFDESFQEEIVAMLQAWGKEKTETYLTKLNQQRLLVRRGRDTITQLLIAGEAPLAVTVYAYNVETLKAKRAPIDWALPDMTPVLLYPLTLARHAPHPYSAALFYDFMLSDQGQQVIAEEGRVLGNPKIEPIYPRMRELKKILGTPRVQVNRIEADDKQHKESLRLLDEVLLKRTKP
jgi:iron(III) transport system substrate-binding protein